MKYSFGFVVIALLVAAMMSFTTLAVAQQTAAASGSATVIPQLIKFSGVAKAPNGQPLTGMVGITFALYSDQQGGSPLWLETQNVQLDSHGNYTVQLGATLANGLPSALFTTGEARWVGAQISGQEEQPRVMLLSVPYAMKAGDAQTLNGQPASAFLTASSGNATNGNGAISNAITGSGTTDYVPLWLSTSKLGSSKIFQSTAGDLGIDTTSPAASLDVNGTSDIRNTLTLFPKGSAPTLSVSGTAFQVSNTGAVTFVSGQTFPGTGTVTSVGSGAGLTGGPITKSGTLSVATGGVTNAMLQYSSLTVTANSPLNGGGAVSLGGSTSLGLKSCGSNQILEYASGAWTCVNIPVGTITGVTAGTDLTGGGSSGNVTLNVDTTKVPQLSGNNTFSGTQTINNNVTVTATGTTLMGSGGTTGLSGTGSTYGVAGSSSSGYGVHGYSTASQGAGVHGQSQDTGVFGQGGAYGVYGVGSVYSIWGNSTSGTGVYGSTSYTDGDGVTGWNSGGGDGMYGYTNDTTGNFAAVHGQSVSVGYGVYGQSAMGNGVYGTTGDTSGAFSGVFANDTGSNYGAGVYGQDSTTGLESETGMGWSYNGAGVWGDGGADWTTGEGNFGVVGTADDHPGGQFENNSASYSTLWAFNYNEEGYPFGAYNDQGINGSYGCNIDPNGDINCTGSKNAVVPIDGGQRKVALSAIESPKNWFEDFGSAQLANGSAIVTIDPEYQQTVNTEMDYKVFPVPNGECNGLYVTHKTATSFEVRELHSGTSSVSFDYRIVALRKNYENIRMADHTHDLDAMKKMMAKRGSGAPFRFDSSKMKVPEMPAPMAPHQPPQMRNPVPPPAPPQMPKPAQAPK